jgi:hypothetical protein
MRPKGNPEVMKLLATAVLALALPAVAAGGTTAGGLRGLVLIDPAYPVCPVNGPCTKPAPNVWLVFSRDGRAVARTRTAQDGTYRIRLKTGTYTVSTQGRKIRTTLAPRRVVVPAGRYKRVVFKLDIGIQ